MHLFIVNPIAGKKLSLEEKLQTIRPYAENLGEPYEIYVTTGPMDAAEKVRAAAAEGDNLRVYSCGGDGTLNEVINGAFGYDNVEVTVFPCGTGNDFIKMFGDKASLFNDMQALIDGKSVPLDIMDCNGRKCVNICSVGIDARIGTQVHKYSSIPLIGGVGGYIISLVVNFIKGIAGKLDIEIDGENMSDDFTLMCACNGQYYGGFFHPSWEADPSDGLIEFLIVRRVSRFRFISLVMKYATGKHNTMGDVLTYIRTDKIKISSEEEMDINADGELLKSKTLNLRLIPSSIKFVLPVGLSMDDVQH